MASENSFGGLVAGTSMEPSSQDIDKFKSKKLNAQQATTAVSKKKSSANESKANEAMSAKMMVKHAFGSNALSVDGVQSFSTLLGEKETNDRILYRVGRQLCIFDPERDSQQFFIGRLKGVVNIIHFSISQNSRYVCICETLRNEKSDPGHSQASVYSLTTFSRQKTLVHPSTTEFISCCFCGDSKYVMTLSDDPDRLLALWQWEKERLVKTTVLTSRVTKISPSPTNVQIIASGPGYLKTWFQGTDGGLRMASMLPPAKEAENFIDHTWLPTVDAKRVIALSDSEGTDSQSHRQSVYIFESGESTGASVSHSNASNAFMSLDLRQSLVVRLDSVQLRRVIPFGRGFVLAGSVGHLSFFERTDDKKEPYQEFRTLNLGKEVIVGGTIPPSEERIVLLTESHSLLTMSLQNIDPLTTSDDQVVTLPTGSDLTFGGFHRLPVTGSDIAHERPSLVTISQDRTARVWNFVTCKCDLVHDFKADEPTAVAMYYTGFEVLVAFKERVRLYNVLLDKLKPIRETSIKGSKDLKFSNSGSMWAVASTVSVLVFDRRTFQQLASFQGHLVAVKRVEWGPGDQLLFSAGAEGSVYGWPVRMYDASQRVDRLDLMSTSSSNNRSAILGLAVDGDPEMLAVPGASTADRGRAGMSWVEEGENESPIIGNSVVISIQDGSLKIADWDASVRSVTALTPSRETQTHTIVTGLEGVYITELRISSDRQLVYAGTNTGAIRIYPWPLQEGNTYSEVLVHSCPVVGIRESPAGNSVISVGSDGSVFVNVVFRGEQAMYATNADALDSFGNEGDTEYNSDVILVSAGDIDDHVKEVVDLQKRLEDAHTKHTFELHQRESAHNESLRRLTEQQETLVNSERDKYESLQLDFDHRLRELTAAMESKAIDHHKVTSELENRYEHKLATQLERYDRMSEEMEKLKQDYAEGLALAMQKHELQLNHAKAEAKATEKRFKAEIKHHKEDRVTDENSFKEVLDQQENEYEDELRQLIAAAEAELKSERESITKLRAFAETKSTKIGQLKTKVKELKAMTKASQQQLVDERREKQKLLDTIEHCKKNLFEREEALSEKEKVILELRNSTRTLENFRFVLDSTLQQLLAERGPITKHIEGLEHHIRTMYEELVEEFDAKKDKHMQDELKDLKLQSFVQEVDRLRHQYRQQELYIASFKRELSNAVGAPGGPKDVEAAAKSLYKKYVRGEVGGEVVRARASTLAESRGDSFRSRLGTDNDDPTDAARRKSSPLLGASGPFTETRGGTAGTNAGKDVDGDDRPTRDVDNDLVEAAKEAERQKSFAERRANNLTHRLQSTKAEAMRVNHGRLLENSQLVFECNELRREMKIMSRELDATKQREAELSRQLQSLRAGTNSRSHGHRNGRDHSTSGTLRMKSEPSCILPGEGSDSLLMPDFMASQSSLQKEDSSYQSQSSANNVRPVKDVFSASGSRGGGELIPSPGETLPLAQEWRGVTSLVSKVKSTGGSGGHSRDRKTAGEDGTPTSLSRTLPTPISVQLSGRLKLSSTRSTDGLENTLRKSQGVDFGTVGSMAGHAKTRGREELVVRRLGREVEQLSAQLDESGRVNVLHNSEITRLRQDLAKKTVLKEPTKPRTHVVVTKPSSRRRSRNSDLQMTDSDDVHTSSKGPIYNLDPDYENSFVSLPSTASSGPSKEDLDLMKLA